MHVDIECQHVLLVGGPSGRLTFNPRYNWIVDHNNGVANLVQTVESCGSTVWHWNCWMNENRKIC